MGTFPGTVEVSRLSIPSYITVKMACKTYGTAFGNRCEVRWQKFNGTPPLVVADVRSPKLVNINITSTLVELFQTVKENWTQDYSVLSSKER